MRLGELEKIWEADPESAPINPFPVKEPVEEPALEPAKK